MAQTAQLVRVKAIAGARRERLEELAPHSYRIAVKEPAQQGSANARLRLILALRYGVPLDRVRLQTGATSPQKRFSVIL